MYCSIKADVLERLFFSEDSSFLCFQRVSFFGESFPCLAHSCGQVRLILRSSRLNLAIKGAVGLRRANVALLGDVLQ